MSDGDDRDYRPSGSRYCDEEDDDRGGHSGWYGDPRGHSEASRRGWKEVRRGSRHGVADDYRRSRPRYDEDDDDRRGHGGWFGDSLIQIRKR
jgi:hypothetical protein